MNILEAELKENERICLENCCRLELIKRQNVPKIKIPNFQSVVCENSSKLQINYLHNLKASIKFYVLKQNRLSKFRITALQLWREFCNFAQ